MRWRGRWWQIAVLVVVTGVVVGSLPRWGGAPERAVAALLLVWFIPGAALLFALTPERLDRGGRLVLSVPASFALTVITGIVLDRVPPGLTAPAFLVSLASLSLVLLTIGAIRRGRRAGDVGDGPPGTASTLDALLAVNREAPVSVSRHDVAGASTSHRLRWLGYVAVGLLLVASVVWAVQGMRLAAHTEPKPYTALGLEPFQAGGNSQGAIVIDNQEGRAMTYDLEVRDDGQAIARQEGLKLAAGEQQRFALPLPAGEPVEVLLFRSGDSDPMRRVFVRGESASGP